MEDILELLYKFFVAAACVAGISVMILIIAGIYCLINYML